MRTELCVAPNFGKDANGNPLAGAAARPIDDHFKAGNVVFDD